MLPTMTKSDSATFETHVSNLMTAHASATADQIQRGTIWYPDALAFAFELSELSGLTVDTCAGVIAALSPQKEWNLNKRLARDAVTGNVHGQTSANCDKVRRIIAGESARSVLPMIKKTGNFYLNIIGELDDAVTIDRHAARAIDPADASADEGLGSDGRYAYASHVYRETARRLGIAVGTLQAIVWTVRVDAFQWVRTS